MVVHGGLWCLVGVCGGGSERVFMVVRGCQLCGFV